MNAPSDCPTTTRPVRSPIASTTVSAHSHHPGRLVVGKVRRDRVVVALAQLGLHQMPVPAGVARSVDQHVSRHGVAANPYGDALSPSASASTASRLRLISPRQSVIRKTKNRAAKPSATASAATAICWPTENESTATRDGPVERRDEQRLLGAGAAGRERQRRRDRLHGHQQADVLERAADVERLEEEPEGREARQPADELPRRDLAQVLARGPQDRRRPA